MNRIAHKSQNMNRRKHRTRAIITGTSQRPRLSAHISHKHVAAQIIDDTGHTTLAYISTVGHKDAQGTLTAKATWVGNEIAKKAKAAKIQQVVFDRGGRLYHGRLKALADAARAGGLEF